ncbi:MAG: four helix bundle protein [Kiritimatiellae bacterium]|nr:four helix bundle protein [Kiritimatiellia bacterium]
MDKHGRTRIKEDSLIPRHSGYRNTKTWQLADLIYDVTVRFCDKFVDRRSRTHDQMVQAARSGVQNLQEGSVDSAVSKKIEMKLTGIAKGSLEELRRDYEKYLRHRDLPEWPPDHPALLRLKALRVKTLDDFRAWLADEVKRSEHEKNTDQHGQTRRKEKPSASGVRVGPCLSVSSRALSAVLAANGALCLLNLCTYLIGRQLESQAKAFEQEGGFTERLYRRRTWRRQQGSN